MEVEFKINFGRWEEDRKKLRLNVIFIIIIFLLWHRAQNILRINHSKYFAHHIPIIACFL